MASRGPRTLELMLLCLAAGLVTLALVLVEAERHQQVPRSLLYLGLGYLGLFAAAHVAVRLTARHADPVLLPTAALLNGLGLVMIHRLDLAKAARGTEFGGATLTADAPRQLAWTALAAVLLIGTLGVVRDHRLIARYSYLAGTGGLALLLLPGLLPARISEVNGAKLWLRLGPLSFQPGELAKILLICFTASFLVTKRELFRVAGRRVAGVEFPRARDLAPLLVAWMFSIGVLALERELGASLLIFGVVLSMIYIATSRAAWLIVGLAFFAASSLLAYEAFGHVRERVQTWLDPNADYSGAGYQLSQSLFGLGTGGLGGTGLGAGRPELVPLANADFIAAALGEELGLLGLGAVLVLYLLLVGRGMRIALSCRDPFGTLLAAGLSTTIGVQVFIVVGGVTNLIPMTGLTTPFLSYGGSSLLANYISVALLIRISDTANRPQATGLRTPRPPLSVARTELVHRPGRPR